MGKPHQAALEPPAAAPCPQLLCVPDEVRFQVSANGSPALGCVLVLTEAQARELTIWFDARCWGMRAEKWAGWNPGDMALRTICVQVDTYFRRAFGRPIQPAQEGDKKDGE